MRVVFVHGACVRDGDWWWHPTAGLLAARGIESVAPRLPSCGETGMLHGTEGRGLADDVAAVRAVLASSDEPTVVVAHSYGGIVASEAAAGISSVSHLVYVSSYLPEVGESLSSFPTGAPAPFLDVDPDAGTFTVGADLLVETFLQDCSPEVGTEAAKRLADQNLAVTQEPVGFSAWHDVPSTYVVCARDRGTPAKAQREFARRAGRVVELDTGHHPFLSQPAAMAHLVVDLALGVDGQER